jgi:methanogenic corrinoid protein MtbC1
MDDCHDFEGLDARVLAFAKAYASALLHGDESAAERAIREAIDAGLRTAEIDDQVIAPALWLVGRLWERGEITIADEHFATEVSMRAIALQREARRLTSERLGHRTLLAAPQGEQHVVALRMIANLLRDAGYDVVMLGPDVPAGALAAAVRRHEPAVICLTSTMPGGADSVLASIDAVQREWPGMGFVTGGQSLSSRVRVRPRLDVCARVSEVVEAVDAMVKRADLN